MRSESNDDDIGLRIYQEKVEKEIPKDEVRIYDKLTKGYISHGVNPQEADVLAHFSVLAEVELIKAETYEEIFTDAWSDMFSSHHYRLNNDGHIIGLYLHSPVTYYLTVLPSFLRKLQFLEILFFPDNFIKKIPEWITELKFLKVLEVRNIEGLSPSVPDTILSFIESLEAYNTF